LQHFLFPRFLLLAKLVASRRSRASEIAAKSRGAGSADVARLLK
jgi:hypothetical protein